MMLNQENGNKIILEIDYIYRTEVCKDSFQDFYEGEFPVRIKEIRPYLTYAARFDLTCKVNLITSGHSRRQLQPKL